MTIAKSRVRWDLRTDKAMAQAVQHARIPLCITNPQLPDNPIVYVNAAFLDLTGYEEDEVLGRNCRFLQGIGTTEESLVDLRRAIEGQKVETVEILNYRKDGSSFENALQIGPILDDDGNLVFFFGSQMDVTAKRDAERKARELAENELVHRLRNIVNVMDIVLRMTAREETDPKEVGRLASERLRTLSDAHLQTINRPDDQALSMMELAQPMLLAYAVKGAAQFELDGPAITLPKHLLSCLALVLHELATNSVKHGALGSEKGRITLTWDIQDVGAVDTLVFNWTETGGPTVVVPKRASGSKIISDLLTATGGTIALDWARTGLIARAQLPLTLY
ncbi:PAS domain-containing protein [Sulfitobacter sp. F26204]|uniref:PAS domain-containing protein n=1 Tax=Sulfitobacter sp. F26204 TaxID=2996014 RepID=UPI00225DD90D|nr:PAS domain-containing protein [Sulfitobacter sp. F26204]MCX7560144.1 PAS domain-containing protein [Sulfitobacter sp. F26204]